MDRDQVELVLSRVGIDYDHIFVVEGGYQIECYGRRAAKLTQKLEQAGFTNIKGSDSRVSRPLAGGWTWYAVASFVYSPPAPIEPKRLFAHLSGDALHIQRNRKSRGYDLRRLTSASVRRLSVALSKYEKSVELDTDLQPTIYFHSSSL